MRKDAGSAWDTAEAAMWLTPVPILDVAVAAIAGGVDHLVRGEKRADLDDARGAVDQNWPQGVASTYVDKVRQQKRELIALEVRGLRQYCEASAMAGSIASTIAEKIATSAIDAVKKALKP